ncbi:MAG: XRE family transcriptional regulator [Micrococcales bacterium]|nr:XRE family transcriptional regulator [Micrococcales bacterium]
MTTSTDRIRDLIADSGLAQGDFAIAVGLDPSKMSKSLAGTRRFSSLDLARIAEHAKVTVDWLMTGEETPLALAARAAAGSSSELAIAEAERLCELRATASRLGWPQPFRPVLLRSGESRAAGVGRALAEEALARLESLGLDAVRLDLAEVIEAAFGVDVSIVALGDGFDGLAVSTPDAKIILAALTAVAFRQRFTIAHELAHVLFGDDQGVHTDPNVYAPTRGDQSEVRANAFASSFLMPESRLRARVQPGFDDAAFGALALELKVSPAALAIRLERLNFIDALASERWKSMSAAQAARASGDATVMARATAYATEPRRPGLLSRDLFAAYVDGKTTLRPYASLLGVDSSTLRADLERSDELGR